MEGRVEHTDLGNLGQQSGDGVDTLDVGRVVERGQIVALGEVGHHLGSEANALVELLAAVHHAVAYGIEFVKILEHGVVAGGEHLEDPLHTGSVLGDGALHLVFLAVELDGDEGIGQADLLDAAGGDDAAVVHIVKCILDATASAVQYQNFHQL